MAGGADRITPDARRRVAELMATPAPSDADVAEVARLVEGEQLHLPLDGGA